jgi:hypothetical protein
MSSGHLANKSGENALKLSIDDVVQLRRNKIEDYSSIC